MAFFYHFAVAFSLGFIWGLLAWSVTQAYKAIPKSRRTDRDD